ncbi:hypothetical protein OG21DRAFT_110980 [Imleria badia]|nr:hypothetical protein OG21DRAFT_110980 [Imleria badia]
MNSSPLGCHSQSRIHPLWHWYLISGVTDLVTETPRLMGWAVTEGAFRSLELFQPPHKDSSCYQLLFITMTRLWVAHSHCLIS